MGQLADGVLGPSQWEPGVSFSTIVGPPSDSFINDFQIRFGSTPDYVAAASFATGLIVMDCIRRAGSLDAADRRGAASDFDCATFHGRFALDAQCGSQVRHPTLPI